VLCAMIWMLAWAVAPAQAVTQTFNYTGAEQTFTVPGGVTSLQVVVIGGSGGDSEFSGGGAAQVTANLSVTPGQTLYVEVGGNGVDGSSGGGSSFNGGAASGGAGAGGGGGASDIRTTPLAAGLVPDNRLIVAAGGGGGGRNGASGSGALGGDAGAAGGEPEGISQGGSPGGETEGGLGGEGCFEAGDAGQRGSGGAGGAGEIAEAGPGGGGGGGYFGGGGGGGACTSGGGGGGGGSSLLAGGSLVVLSPSATPQIQITYTPVPPSISIASPTNGATYTQGQAVTAIYSCTPPEGTGVKTCAGPVPNGGALDTSSLGPHIFAVDAEDTDGVAASKSVSYTVVAAPPSNTAPPATTPLGAAAPNTILGSPSREKRQNQKEKGQSQIQLLFECCRSDLPVQARQRCLHAVRLAQDLQSKTGQTQVLGQGLERRSSRSHPGDLRLQSQERGLGPASRLSAATPLDAEDCSPADLAHRPRRIRRGPPCFPGPAATWGCD
jgi:hypothetical protein